MLKNLFLSVPLLVKGITRYPMIPDMIFMLIGGKTLFITVFIFFLFTFKYTIYVLSCIFFFQMRTFLQIWLQKNLVQELKTVHTNFAENPCYLREPRVLQKAVWRYAIESFLYMYRIYTTTIIQSKLKGKGIT